jgi:tripartite-type tricarboxylate transporter receptor subunit TctC
MRTRKMFLAAVLATAAISLLAGSAVAQTFPTRPVRIAVPFPAGGGTDLLARLLAEELGRKWGQTVYVENLSGAASGSVGASEVARSAPDGHTLMLSPPGPITMNQLLYKSLAYDSSKWVPISVVASVPYVLALRNGFAHPSVKGLIETAKANPEKITYASPGAGTVGHLAAKQFELLAGIKLTTVPYRGLALALKDIVGGHVDLIFDTAATSLPLHQSKQLQIVAVGGSERSRSLPDVPTIAETGLPGFRAVTWYALVAPPETPAAVADKINRDVTDIVNIPAVGDKIRETLQMDPIGNTRAQARQLFVDDTELWAKVIKEANVTID